MREKKRYFWIFWALMFVGAFLVLSQRGYSDGDDAYFYQYTHAMSLPDYLRWRYETWVGRMTAEALVYVTFHLGLWFWRVVNAGMLVLIPLGLLNLAGKVTGTSWKAVCAKPGASIAAVSGYLLMGAMTLGYAAVWVNGSIFYTWTFACGIWAMVPLAELVFVKDGSESDFSAVDVSVAVDSVAFGETASDWKAWTGLNGVDSRKFFYSIPCAVIASMSIEQMGAVLLTFEVLGVIYCLIKRHRVNILMLVQTILTAAAFLVLFAAPGNAVRVAEEIATWMPEFETMSLGQHLFITVQWLLSSFANENKLFLCGIWIVGILLLRQSRKQQQQKSGDKVLTGAAVIFAVAAVLPFFDITLFSDMGISGLSITSRIDKVPAFSDSTGTMLFAMIWWILALVFTLVFLWRVSNAGITLTLAYLAGIASEAIMFFSPTMYASGARVYYLTDLLYLFVMLALSFQLGKEKQKRFYAVMVLLGILNFVFQIPSFLAQL